MSNELVTYLAWLDMVIYGHELAAEACFSSQEFVMLVLSQQYGKVRLLCKLRYQVALQAEVLD